MVKSRPDAQTVPDSWMRRPRAGAPRRRGVAPATQVTAIFWRSPTKGRKALARNLRYCIPVVSILFDERAKVDVTAKSLRFNRSGNSVSKRADDAYGEIIT